MERVHESPINSFYAYQNIKKFAEFHDRINHVGSSDIDMTIALWHFKIPHFLAKTLNFNHLKCHKHHFKFSKFQPPFGLAGFRHLGICYLDNLENFKCRPAKSRMPKC